MLLICSGTNVGALLGAVRSNAGIIREQYRNLWLDIRPSHMLTNKEEQQQL